MNWRGKKIREANELLECFPEPEITLKSKKGKEEYSIKN